MTYEYRTVTTPEEVTTAIPQIEAEGWEFVTLTATVLSHTMLPSRQGPVHTIKQVYTLLFRRSA